MLVSEIATTDNAQLLRDSYTYHLALVANSGLAEDSFKSVQESARETLDKLIELRRPWEAGDRANKLLDEVAQFKEDFKHFAGVDLDDEEQAEKYFKHTDDVRANWKREAEERENAPNQEELMMAASKRVEERRRRAHSHRR